MSYSIDNQTYTDLNLTGRFKQNSIFGLYNKTVTRGGSILLENLFVQPMTDSQSINNRRDVLVALSTYEKPFPITTDDVAEMEEYLGSSAYSIHLLAIADTAKVKFMSTLLNNPHYDMIVDGVIHVNKVLRLVKPFLTDILDVVKGTEFEGRIANGLKLLNESRLSSFIDSTITKKTGLFRVALSNRLIRHIYNKPLRLLLKLVEEVDCFLTVARVGKSRGFVYADASFDSKMMIEIDNVRHPRVPGAVGNDIRMYHDSNLIFLTGANMAGKSTLMKSFGISLYLAHLGFPVAADKMVFTPMEGMYTSINVPDDLSQGYSHFYAEVMRVKGVAQEVAKKKRLLIIFDELFKGTNVKDAYDGTLEITRSFSKCGKSIFIISTHIMEAGETLRAECKNVQFKYLPTLLVDEKPVYPYKLADGIADDRHGMRIVNNERVLEIIRGEE